MKKIIWIIIIILIILFLFFGLNNQKGTDNTVKIGGLFELTGFASFTAEDSRDGFLMAIEDADINIDYVIEDGHSDITRTITAANKLINIDKVDVVVGPEWNEFSEVVSDIGDSNQIAFISPWATSESDWALTPYYFSMTTSERIHHHEVLKHMISKDIKTVALIYTNNAWALEVINIFKDVLSGTDIEIIGDYNFNPDQTDFRTELLKIKEDSPDALFLPIAAGSQTGPFLKQFTELGLDSRLYAPESVGQDNVVRGSFNQYTEGLIFYRSEKYKNTDEFTEKFENKYGRKPTTRTAATAYDTVMIIVEAMKSGAQTSQEIANFIQNINDYEGYSNLINFDERGQLASEGVELVQIQNGKDIVLEK